MGRKTIDRNTFKYWALKNLWAKSVYKLYYRRIELKNAKRVKRDEAIIIAPNHQNALMDALAIVTRLPFQTIFLARADIFKGKMLSTILNYMKILPIYRIRDGVSSLGKNEEIFDYSTGVLKNRYNPMCLFPEGNHGDKRRLRPLVKGIFRIAFQCQEEHGSKPYVKILPTGIDYSHYTKFQQSLLVQFGEPIEVSEYWKDYEENPARAINKLRDRLSTEMRKVIIDIQSEDYYNTILGLRDYYRKNMKEKLGIKGKKLADNFIADKELIAKIEESIEKDEAKVKKLDELFRKYENLRDKLNFKNWVFKKGKYSLIGNLLKILLGLLFLPIFILGFITNWPHYIFPPKFAKKIKDTQFRSTAIWGMGMVIQALYYIIFLVLGLIYLPYWWLAFIAVVTLPFIGLLAYKIRVYFVKTWSKIRYTLYRNKSKDIKEALKHKEQIDNILSEIV